MKPVVLVFARCIAAGRKLAVRIVLASLLLAGSVSAPALGQIEAALSEAMAEGGAVPVIVTFDDSQRPQSGQSGLDGTQQTQNRLEWQRGILQRAIGIDSTELAAPNASGTRLRREYQNIPSVSMFLTPEQIEALSADPAISAIQLDGLSAPQTDGTIPLIGASALHSSGFTGSGVAIAILDTGVDHEHPMFSGRIVESLCFSSNVTDQSTSLCAGGAESDTTSADAGDDCAYTGDTETAITGCGHGTHVAGTAAGASWVDPGTGDTLIGVAPAADIIAIQVFSRFTGLCAGFGYSSPCALTYNSDQIAALDWVLTNHATFNVASANMSLGGGNYSSYCNSDSRFTVINNLRNAGVATVIASGNSGYNSAVGAPACIEPAITVGATDNADNVASFSNSASMVDLLAPGVAINSAEPTVDDTLPGRARSIQGTSMATPHVAGAFALLRSAVPGASVTAIELALESTGVSVTESPSNLVRPRIQVDSAYSAVDTTAPRIASITRQTPGSSPTNSDSVTWRVTFNEAVQNVSADDFTHSGTTATLGINDVSSTQTDVTLSAGDLANLNATVTLGFNGAQNITDLSGNALTNTIPTGTNDNTFVIDNTPPVLQAFRWSVPFGANTNADVLVFAIDFDENVTNVSADDFQIANTTATGTIGGSGSSYTLTVSGGNLADINTTVSLNLDAGQNITDVAGNALPNGEPASDDFYVVDNIPPTVSSITRHAPTESLTPADTLTWRIVFSEDIINIDVSDFIVTNTSATVTSVTSSGNDTFDITASGGDLPDFNGSVTLQFVGGQNLSDRAGNALSNTTPTGANQNSYTLDNVHPRITSIVRSSSSPTQSNMLVWEVTFDGTLNNIDEGDFALNSSTTATITSVVPVAPPPPSGLSSANYNTDAVYVTASGGDLAGFTGNVELVLSGSRNITDNAGNPISNPTPTGTNQSVYAVDNTAPVLTAFTRKTPSGSPTNADTLIFTIIFNEAVQNVSADDFIIVGTTASGVIGGAGSTYTLTLSGGDLANLNGLVHLNLSGSHNIVDMVGISLPTSQPENEEFYTLDNNAPSLTAFVRRTPATEQTNADSLVFEAQFSEIVTNLDASDFAVSGSTATVTDVSVPAPPVGLDGIMATGSSAYITVSGGDLANLNGTVGLNLAGGQNIADEAGNALPGGEPATDQTYSVVNDVTPPTVLFVGRQVPSGELAFGSSVTWRVAFSEAVTGVDAGDFSVSNTTAGLTVTPVSSQIFDVTASGGNFGTVGAIVALTFAEGASITDTVGNAAVNFVPTAFNVNTFDVDNAQPVPTLTAPGTVGGLTPFNVTVNFNETVYFFSEPGELSAYNATVAAPVGSGSNYTVQVTPTGGGDILLRVNGNAVLDRTFVNTNVSSDLVTITYDTTGPTISSIARTNPVTELTNADTLTWRVTFNEAIGAIAPSDFVVSGSTATVQSVSAPVGNARLDSGSSGPTFYDVRVSGGDLANMANGVVSISLSGGQAIADVYGNVLTNTTPTGANDNSYTIRNPDPTLITASVSPGVINAYQGGPSVALFGAIYASSQAAAEGCTISFPEGVPATMTYQLTENGSPVGAVNPVFTVPAGTTLTYAMTVTPTTQTGTEGVDFFPVFSCFNATADTIRGFNSLRLNVGAGAPPRVISFPFSSTFDGVVRIPSSGGLGIMSTIAVNIGEGDGSGLDRDTRMTVSVDTGNAALPVSFLQICQTDPSTGACATPLGQSVTNNWNYFLTQSFGIFVYDNGATGIPFDPANARLFVRYADANGVVRAIDSLPITSPAPVAGLAAEASSVEPGRYAVSVRMPDGEWPNLQQRTLFVQPDGMAIIGGEQPRLVNLADAVEHTSLEFSPNSIRYNIADGREPGEFWGIRDHRSDDAIGDQEAPESFGSANGRSNLYLGADGRLSGIVDGCVAGGRMSAPAEAARGLSFGYVELVSCEAAGVYRTVIDTAANDNAPVHLLIAHETGGWRLAVQ